MTPIEAIKSKMIDDAKAYVSHSLDGVTLNDPKLYKIFRLGQESGYRIATEALAYKGEDDEIEFLKSLSAKISKNGFGNDPNKQADCFLAISDRILKLQSSYKAGEDLEPGIQEYLNKRIKELNEADIEFCKDRWNMDYPELRRHLAREESNKVTFARQELQEVLKLMTKK